MNIRHGLQRIRSTNLVFCIHQILQKKYEYSTAVHQLCVYFRKVYDSVKKEVSYNVLIVFSIPMKLVRLVKMFLHKACSDVLTDKHFSDEFQTASGLEQWDDLQPLHISFA